MTPGPRPIEVSTASPLRMRYVEMGSQLIPKSSKHWDLTIRFMNCNFDILGAIRRAQFQTHPTAGSCFSGAIMWSNFTSFFHFASMYFLVTFGDFWMACHGLPWLAMACQPKMGEFWQPTTITTSKSSLPSFPRWQGDPASSSSWS